MASPSLDDLRAKKAALKGAARTKTASVSLVTADALVSEIEALRQERIDILMSVAREDEDGNRNGPPRKAGEKGIPPRIEEIDARIVAANDELANHQGEVGYIPAMTTGEWIRWKDEHPPREDNLFDAHRAGGYCNATDLIATLGKFVTHWNGQELARGEWDEWLCDAILPRDVQVLATCVVALYETGIERRVPFSSSGSSVTGTSATE
jgi:hypothetical protein